jgi:transposase-like protein
MSSLPASTKERIARLLFAGSNSFRDIARRCKVSDHSVKRLANELGIVDPDRPPRRRRRQARCQCGGPKMKGECPRCLQDFREEVARRRRELQRELRDDPLSILKRLGKRDV